MKYTIQICDFIFQVICSAETAMKILSIEIQKENSRSLSNNLPAIIIQLKNSIENTLLGGNTDFIEENLSFNSLTPKEIQVLRILKTIPRGTVISYSELGKKAGLGEHAGRFIGNVMAKNPFPVLYPCHRVLNKSGVIGNYSSGGPEIKKKLLLLEGFDKFKH